ncbi:MAG: ATP-binding protein [Deltaproteobacteria bacterium]
MFNSFRRRLTGTYLIVIVTVLIFIGLLGTFGFRAYLFDNIKASMQLEAKLIAESLALSKDEDSNYFARLAKSADEDSDTRVTIIDSTGKVLADSEFAPSTLGNHKDRPEVYQALKGSTGIQTRFSDTAKVKTIYVAVPFKSQSIDGVVRLARPLTEIENLYRKSLYMLLLALLLGGALTAIISVRLADRFSRPLTTITEAVQDMAAGNLKRRVLWDYEDELGTLSTAVNEMASRLDANIQEISTVKNRLEMVLDNTVNGILMVAADGRVTYANPVAMTVLGSDKRIIGRKHFEAVANYDLLTIIDQVRKDGFPYKGELVLNNLGGKIIEVHAVPISETEGFVPAGVLLVLNDITELKRLEQVRKDFIANISHELKTPVANISGFAETLLSEQSENEHVHEFSSIIYDESQRLRRLIDSLIKLSNLETGTPELNLVEVDARDLVNEVVRVALKRNEKRGLKIESILPDKPVMIKVDRDSIVQVLINLMKNAIAYNLDNKPIRVELSDNDAGIRISVQDQGEGIPESDIKRIFERFYRVDKTRSRKTGGTGLGLSIAKHLVENHGGEVGVDSRLGIGSTFFFTIPRQ